MLVVSILEADNFGDELYPIMRNTLTDIINFQHVGLIIAGGDEKGMIYRLLCEMAVEYPDIFFTILLSNDKTAYQGSDRGNPHIFSLNFDIVYGDPRSVKQRRREDLIQRSDVVICPRKYSKGIREINRHCDIVVI